MRLQRGNSFMKVSLLTASANLLSFEPVELLLRAASRQVTLVKHRVRQFLIKMFNQRSSISSIPSLEGIVRCGDSDIDPSVVCCSQLVASRTSS